MYFEVEASKTTDMTEYTQFDKFSEDVELQFDVPLYLVGPDRNYFLMDSVMGVCTLMDDVDRDADTLSVDTNELSTVLLMYQDKSEALGQTTPKLQIKAQYLFIGAIVLLILIWWGLDRRSKKK